MNGNTIKFLAVCLAVLTLLAPILGVLGVDTASAADTTNASTNFTYTYYSNEDVYTYQANTSTSLNDTEQVTVEYTAEGTNFSSLSVSDLNIDLGGPGHTIDSSSFQNGSMSVTFTVDGKGADRIDVTTMMPAGVDVTMQEDTVSATINGNNVGSSTYQMSTDDPDYASPGSISGQVMDTNSTAIENADVTVEYASNGTVVATNTTDAGGYYDVGLDATSTYDYDVTVTADGYQSTTKTVTVSADESANVDFSLSETLGEGTVEGTITNSVTGDNISDPVTVEIVDSNDTVVKSVNLDSGQYNFNIGNVTEGDYTIQTVSDHYVDSSQSITVNADQTTTADFSLTPLTDVTVDVVKPDGTDAEDGDTVSVFYDGSDTAATTATVSNGSATLTIEEGHSNYTVEASDANDSFQTFVSDNLSNVSEVDSLTVKYEDYRTVTVNVEDSNGSDIDAGTADLLDADGNISQTVNVSNGTAEFSGVSDGTGFSVDVNVSGYDNVSSSTFEVNGDETLNATLYEDGVNESSTITHTTDEDDTTGGTSSPSGSIPTGIVVVVVIIGIVGATFVVLKE